MNNEKGFTLIEVLASLVIVTIILLAFSQIFISNNQYANKNTEKLVVVNLADAYLERIRVTAMYREKEIDFFVFEMNGKAYQVKVESNQTQEEKDRKIQNVVVTVSILEDNVNPLEYNASDCENNPSNCEGNRSTTVEGYVVYE